MKLNQIVFSSLIALASSSVANSQTITTVAGVIGSPGYVGDAGPANNARFNQPRAVATDNDGNLYIADMRNHVIRKVNPNGIVNTVAGNGTAGTAGAGGPATAAQLAQPTGMTIDNDGNIYIADYNASVIKKVTTSGIMTIFAGNGTEGFSGDGGPASQAKLYRPTAVAVDKEGSLYISDASNKVIRKVTKAGVITTIAGVPGRAGYAGDGGPATKALLTQPAGIAVDYSGNVYIADPSNSVIRKVNPSGIITTFAGTGVAGYSGDNGPAIKAQFQIGSPQGLAVDPAGNVYASDYQNHAIRKINAKGIITTIAGNGAPDYAGDGGPAILAKIWYPIGIATDAGGNVFITDSYNNTIREIVSSCTAPTPSFDQQPISKSVCKGGNTTFTVTVNNADNYQWQQFQPATGEWIELSDGANFSGVTTNTLTVNGITDKMNNNQFRVMANNACKTLFSNKASLTVTGGANPTLAIAPALNGMCTGSPAAFTVKVTNGGAAPAYKWIVNGNDAGSNSQTYSNAALANGDKVSCVLTSAAGCAGGQIVSNVIEVKMGSAPEVKTNTEIKIFEGFSAKLSAVSENQISGYSWSPAAGVTAAHTANPIVKPAKTTTYKVTAVNASGCAGTAEVTVTVVKRIVMPKTFSAKGGVFQIPSVDPAFNLGTFQVLNAAGKVVFSTTDINKGWNGTISGAKAPVGKYTYSITGTLQTGKINLKGMVQLLP
jgi:sugar lactone lactonase YvrE